MTLSFVLIALLLAIGLWMLCGVIFFHDTSFEGSTELRRYGKWRENMQRLSIIDLNSYLQSLTRHSAANVYPERLRIIMGLSTG